MKDLRLLLGSILLLAGANVSWLSGLKLLSEAWFYTRGIFIDGGIFMVHTPNLNLAYFLVGSILSWHGVKLLANSRNKTHNKV